MKLASSVTYGYIHSLINVKARNHCEDGSVVRRDKITADFIQGRSLHISGLPAGEENSAENSAYENGMKSEVSIPAACGENILNTS